MRSRRWGLRATWSVVLVVALALLLLPVPPSTAEPLLGNDPDRAPIPGAVPGAPGSSGTPTTSEPSASTSPSESSSDQGDVGYLGSTGDGATEGEDQAATSDDTVHTAGAALPVRRSVAAVGDVTPDVVIEGRGWGHSVGLSQFGAYAMALEGRSAAAILTHYYAGTRVTTQARASSDRIRVGIAINRRSTPVTALDGPVTWQVCTPEADPVRNGRVPADRCQEWFTQPVGRTVVIAPLPADGGPDGSPAPRGGLLVTDPAGKVLHVHRTPQGTPADRMPVARAVHGDGRIEAESYAAPQRRYAYGWRDFHLTGARVDDPDNHRLAIVQDVDNVERYLRGLAEVPSSWPHAALEAQAIAGRTYALRGSRGGGCFCDRLATAADQVYIGESKVEEPTWGVRWAQAVTATKDRVLTYEGRLAETYYSSSFGGRSENVEDSWAYYRAYQDPERLRTNPPPAYLRSVDDPWSLRTRVGDRDISNSRREWTARASNAALVDLVNRERDTPYVRIDRIRIGERTEGGTPRTLRLTGTLADGSQASMTYRGSRTSDGRTLARPIAGANLRMELPLVAGGESNGRLSSSQVHRIAFGPFTDDDGDVHELAIAWAAKAGVVRGISDTRFAPRRAVTRGQMATYLVNTLDVPTPGTPPTFTDMTSEHVHADSIHALVGAGVVAGYTDVTFRPDEPVTRAQMATFLTNALGWSTTQRGSFDDVGTDDVHAASIEAIAARGVTSGCDATRFCGSEPVQRGQLATFLYRVVVG